MNLGFSQIIGAIEAEIDTIYLSGAIQWADNQFHGAWSAALERFDKALAVALERKDPALAKTEGAYYKATVIDLLSKYKNHKKMNDTQSFLKGLSTLKGASNGQEKREEEKEKLLSGRFVS